MMDQMYVSSRQELYFLKNPRHARKWTKSPEGKKKKTHRKVSKYARSNDQISRQVPKKINK